MSTGKILSASFSVFFANLVPFVGLTAMVFLPVIAYSAWFILGFDLSVEDGMDAVNEAFWSLQIYGIVAGLAALIAGFVATGAVTYGVVEQLRGRHAPIGKCVGVGLSRLFPVIGVGLLVGLATVGGLLLLVIPGMIVATMLWLSVPVAVVEAPGVMASLKRSRELTAGYRWTVFGVIFILGAISGAVDKILEKSLISTTDFDLGNLKLYLALAVGTSILFSALTAVANAVTYFKLRQEQEGADLETLAAVFE